MRGCKLFLLARFGAVQVSDFKSESYARRYPDASVVHHSFSPLGDVDVFASSYFHFAPGLSDNAAVALPRMPRNAFLGMFADGNSPVGIMRKLGPQEDRYMDYLPMSAPYGILKQPRVLVLKLGGGAGVHTALHHGARSVSVKGSNGDLVRMLRDDPFFRQSTGDFLADPRVSLVNAEVRALAGSAGESALRRKLQSPCGGPCVQAEEPGENLGASGRLNQDCCRSPVPTLLYIESELFAGRRNRRIRVDWKRYITLDPSILAGKPIIKGTRLSVEFIIDLLAQGWSEGDVRKNYPGMEGEHIQACLAYASDILRSEKVYPLTV